MPEIASVPPKLTLSDVRYQPFAFGWRDGVALACGAVASYFNGRVVFPTLPALSVHVRLAGRRRARLRRRRVVLDDDGAGSGVAGVVTARSADGGGRRIGARIDLRRIARLQPGQRVAPRKRDRQGAVVPAVHVGATGGRRRRLRRRLVVAQRELARAARVAGAVDARASERDRGIVGPRIGLLRAARDARRPVGALERDGDRVVEPAVRVGLPRGGTCLRSGPVVLERERRLGRVPGVV